MLTAAELALMRTTTAQALPGTAVFQSKSFTDDGGGGGTVAWSAGGTVSCRIAPLTGSEREEANRISTDADYIVTLPAETSIVMTQRMVIAGGTFDVRAVRDRSYETTRRVEVEKVS